MSLTIRPISITKANLYIEQYHRHNGAMRCRQFSLACYDGDKLVGVAVCGNPCARRLDDGLTLEINRCCTDGTRNACSKLYSSCIRVAKEMGYARVITYTLETECGASLLAANFHLDGDGFGCYSNTSEREKNRAAKRENTLFPMELKRPPPVPEEKMELSNQKRV